VAELWQRASAEERAPYGAAAAADQERYHAELEAFNYRCVRARSMRSRLCPDLVFSSSSALL
jgi:hypothetical protein